MQVTSGTRLGPYEIVSRIGAGGMGEVWRARDTRLDRNVAIKILPADFAQNAQLRLRFEREAKTISQFTHPHICTLHDIGHESGTDYLVMELLDGETLAERLARGPLPLGDVLRYGAQIATALDRAHRAGIVHRDLKPGNVMITTSGAKLLDFGLAKTAALQLTPDDVTQQQHKSLTQEGTIVGTFQYMSPEQLEGIAVDHRTDIFALGAVLYEMATGRRAFEGKTKTSLIAAIVSADPKPVADLQPMAPRALDHVIRRCLQKDPEQRWQSAHDIADELTWIATELDAPVMQPKKTNPLVWIALALLAASIGAAAMYFARAGNVKPRSVTFSILPPRGFNMMAGVLSPDGDAIAYIAFNTKSEVGLWVRRFDELEGRRLIEPSANRDVYHLLWSPDGKWIAHMEGRDLVRTPVAGGGREMIARNAGYGVGGAWSSKGTILWTPRWGTGIHRVAAAGGELVPITRLDTSRREAVHAWPKFLPDEDHFLYIVRTVAEEKNEIYAGALSKPLKKPIVRADALTGYWNGWLLFVRDGSAYAQRFDADELALEGEPQKIIDGVRYDEDTANSHVSVARDGGVLYEPVTNTMRRYSLNWHDLSGHTLGKVHEDVGLTNFHLAPDDTKLLVLKTDTAKGAADIYTVDVARGVQTKITGGLSNHRSAIWSSDGSEIYFSSDRDGMYDLYAQRDDGTAPARLIWKSDRDKHCLDVTPDGRYLIVTNETLQNRNDIWLVATDGSAKAEALIATPGTDDAARLSNDGQWLAYSSNHSGRFEVYVRRFPRGRSVQISIGGGNQPRWSRDGSQVYFATPEMVWMKAVIERDGDTPRPGRPVPMYEIPTGSSVPLPSRLTDRLLASTSTDPGEALLIGQYTIGWAEKLEK